MTTNIYARVRNTVVAALQTIAPDLPPDVAARVEVTPARDPAHGDMATNAAMVSAKAARQAPAKIAQALAAALADGPDVMRAEPAGPGFVNLHLRPDALRAVIPAVLRAGEAFGAGTVGGGIAVNVEYVSANPTGPMHIGHCRGAVVGDALANLMQKAGFAVTKEYYINDAGAQVAALAWAAYWRYLQAIGTAMTRRRLRRPDPRSACNTRANTSSPSAKPFPARHAESLAGPGGTIADPAVWLDTVREATVAAMMASIRTDLAALGVVPDVFTSGTHAGRVRRGGSRDRPPGGPGPDLRRRRWNPRKARPRTTGNRAEQTLFRGDAVRRRRRPAAAQVRRLATPTSPTTSPITPTRWSAARSS